MDWKTIEKQLQKHFEPQEIRFRLQGTPRQREGKLMVQAVAYVPAYKVAERLDEAVGAENWTFRSTPLASAKGKVSTVKGCMSLLGGAPKEEFGEYARLEPDETPVSEALRRCAFLWGVGRYLAQLEIWVEVPSQDPKSWAISPAELSRFRGMLPQPDNNLDPEGETTVAAAAGEREAMEAETAEETALLEEEEVEEVVAATEEEGEAEAEAEVETAVFEEMEEAEGVETATEAEEEEDIEEAEAEVPAFEETEEDEEAEAEMEEEMEEAEEAEAEMEEEEDIEEAGAEMSASEETEEVKEAEVQAEIEMAEEAVASATEEAVEQADPEKILAIRRLCNELGEQEPVGLIEMAPAEVEGHLVRLMNEWGKRQRLASTSGHREPALIQASTNSASVGMVSDEQWREYVRLHTLVRGKAPNNDARNHLKPSTVALMIEALQRELNQRGQLQEAEAVRSGR